MSAAPVISIAQPKLALWQIVETIDAYLDTLDMIETQEEREQAEAELSAYLEQLARKVDNTVEFLDFLESRQTTRKLQVVRLEKANKRDQAIIDRIESSIQRVIESGGRDRLEGSVYTLRLKKCPPSVEVLNQSLVPADYIRVKVEESVDKAKAKADLKAGVSIDGLALVLDRKSVVRA